MGACSAEAPALLPALRRSSTGRGVAPLPARGNDCPGSTCGDHAGCATGESAFTVFNGRFGCTVMSGVGRFQTSRVEAGKPRTGHPTFKGLGIVIQINPLRGLPVEGVHESAFTRITQPLRLELLALPRGSECLTLNEATDAK